MSSHYNQNINGWIILDKPKGMSSNQVLRKIQYLLHAKKAGHIGTLDPFATGVLPLAFGEATKLIPYMEKKEKSYEFTLKFGEKTTTDDTEGEICNTSDKIPSADEIQNIIPCFMGKIVQTPPKYSAIHVNGQRAYTLARQGKTFELPKREVEIRELSLLKYDIAQKEAAFSVTCSSGTYIRTLGCDIAEKLTTYGHLSSLRRTKNGFFNLSDTILLDNLKNMLYKNGGVFPILPVETFLCDITVIALTQDEALKFRNGQHIESERFYSLSNPVAACLKGRLVALAERKENSLHPIRVFNL